LENCSRARRGDTGTREPQTKITVRWTRTVMRELLEISDACGLSLTSASSAFFNAGSFRPGPSNDSPLSSPVLSLFGDDRVSSRALHPADIFLFLLHYDVLYLQIKFRDLVPLLPPPPVAGIFRLLIENKEAHGGKLRICRMIQPSSRACLPACLSVCLSVCPSVRLSIRLTLFLAKRLLCT